MTSADTTSPEQETVLILRPSRGFAVLNLRDLWIYRELVFFLTWRDLKVRYRQTALGAAWAILVPVVEMVVFTVLFGEIAQLSSEGIPYAIFNFAALLPWGIFSKGLNDAGRSLVNNRNMITKVYFPRLVIPVASIGGGLADFAIGFVVLIGLVAYFNFSPLSTYTFTLRPALLTLPLFLLLALVTTLGVSLWFSALNVTYRDVGYALPFVTQVWFFLTPIIYSSSEILEKLPQGLRWIYAINPMVGVVEGFRWALLGTETAPGVLTLISALVSLLVLVSGLFYFRRMERTFADEI